MFKFPSVLRADRNARYAAGASLSPSKPFRPHKPRFQRGNPKFELRNPKNEVFKRADLAIK